jgi:hypothetical protein
MDAIEILLQAIETLRPELPTLVGADWPAFERRLSACLVEIRTQPENELLLRAQILYLFGQYPQAHVRLVEIMCRAETKESLESFAGGKGVTRGLESNTEPPSSVTRYTDIACPRRVWVSTPRFTVVVRLTLQPSPYSAAAEELVVSPDAPVQVLVQAPAFDILGEPKQETPILPDRDSPPLVFDLRPRQVGHAGITFDFFQNGQPLRTAHIPVEVAAFEVTEGAEPKPVGALRVEADVTPPDMVLHIAYQETPPALHFTLIRNGGASWQEFAPVALTGDPQSAAAEFYRKVTSLVDNQEPTLKQVVKQQRILPAADVDRRVKQLGQNLWRTLIPGELKALYAREREQWRGCTLLIFSDEPHLPWELLWPYEPGGYDDPGPWCETLRLTRWLRKDAAGNGNEQPPARLHLRTLAVVAPAYSILRNLAAAQRERAALLELMTRYNLTDASPAEPSWSAVVDLLESGGYDWFHAAAHGNFYAASPDGDSGLWLQQDMALTPDSIVGEQIEGHLKAHRPGFFLNACQAGRQGWALTQIGGWANRLIGAGAGLFIGPLWEVRDDSAFDFAQVFYGALLAGKPVAEATQLARLAARRAGDPTWLAYSVYAHPNAQLTA